MSLLHRYIFKELLYHFALLVAVFTVILLAKEIHDTRDEIMEYDPPAALVAEYVLCSILPTLARALPLVSMFAVLFALGLMARSREILAMVAAGVSFLRLMRPVLLYGLLITALSALLNESLAPGARRRADWLYEVGIRKKNPLFVQAGEDIFRRGADNRLYRMAGFDGIHQVMTRPAILELNEDGSGLARRMEADRGRLLESGREGSLWEFDNAETWTFGVEGRLAHERQQNVRRLLDPKLESLLAPARSADEMSAAELRDYCLALRRQGASLPWTRHMTRFQARLSLPLSSLLLALAGFAIAADLRHRRFVRVFTTGLVLGVVYFMLHESLIGAGSSRLANERLGTLAPFLAAWLPAALFAFLSVGLIRRLSVVH